MTFIAPVQTPSLRDIVAFGRKAARSRSRILVSDEDGARRALGSDGGWPLSATTGASLENLARVALG